MPIDTETIEPLANQTQFAAEEAAKEQPERFVEEAPKKETAVVSPQTKKLRVLIGVLVVLLLLTGVTLLLGKPKQKMTLITQPSPTPVSVSVNNPELQQRITELQADLQNADPTKNDFTFPPVQMNLQLEKDR